MEIIPKLNLNDSPKGCKNNSLVYANDIKINNEDNTLGPDNSIHLNETIRNRLYESVKDGEGEQAKHYEIKGVIACNTELILFVNCLAYSDELDIYRYNENVDICNYVTTISFKKGNIIGTFTYNFNNELIIVFSEYNATEDVPLRTINLGIWDDEGKWKGEHDLKINNDLYYIVPKVIIPNINTTITNGNAYKGWYYVFIRYKINDYDYTQWYNTNESVFITDFKYTNIHDYYVSKDTLKLTGYEGDLKKFTNSSFVNISDDKDICSISFICEINNIDTRYETYQLGFINITKNVSRGFKSNDINVVNNNFIFNSKTVENIDINSLLLSYNNYYDVKKIINYNNRLYISNYKENNIDINLHDNVNIDDFSKNTKHIDLTLDHNIFKYVDITATKRNSEKDRYLINRDVPITIINNNYYVKFEEIIVYNINKIEPFIIRHSAFNYITICRLIFDSELKRDYIEVSHLNLEIDKLYYKVGSYGTLLYKNEDKEEFIDFVHFVLGHVENPDIISQDDICTTCVQFGDINEKIIYNNNNKINNTINYIGIAPFIKYNFFIHFVDEYGQISNGYSIKDLYGMTTYFTFDDYFIGEKTLPDSNYDIPKKIINTIQCKVSAKKEFIKKYPAYFISYEYIEESIYKGILYSRLTEKTYKFKCQNLNFDETINLNFTHIVIIRCSKENNSPNREININYILKKPDTIEAPEKYKIKSLSLELDNNNGSYINIILEDGITINDVSDTDPVIAYLVNEDDSLIYKNDIKKLIPCSKINYNYDDMLEVNTKNAFCSVLHNNILVENSYFDDSIKVFKKYTNMVPDMYNFESYYYSDYIDVPYESLSLKNEPPAVVFPVEGLDTTDKYKKSFYKGKVIQNKNFIDLFKQNNVNYYELYPKTLLNHYKSTNTNNINKIIRRSNVLKTESFENPWRRFNIEEYKIINENKGDITNIVGIGKFLLVHTEHSLFYFDTNNTLQSDNDGIQLKDVDVFDLNYKEVITSNLGFIGLQDPEAYILDNFGYIFYDNSTNRFYQFDNNSLNIIDIDIYKWLIKYKPKNVRFAHDIENERILINMLINGSRFTLSYNYNTKSFISFHSYSFDKGINTKSKLYYLFNKEFISQYDYTTFSSFNVENVDKPSNHTINIIVNANYYDIKFLEQITYKLHKVKYIDDLFISDADKVNTIIYSGDILNVYNNLINTGDLSINVDNNNDENIKPSNHLIPYNKIENYKLPYYYLGQWNFNYLRDIKNINNIVDDNNKPINQIDKNSRLFGNYFIIKFVFVLEKNSDKPFKLESISYKLSN